jgi:hypothetical protein
MYIKNPKPKIQNQIQNINHFLHLTKTQNQIKSIANPKKKDLKTKTTLKVLCLFTKKSANTKI